MKSSIGIIGAGNMGGAIFKKLIEREEDVFIYDIDRRKVENNNALKKFLELGEIEKKAQIIILAIKPQSLNELSKQFTKNISDKLIISIMAGVKIKRIEQTLKLHKIVRAMPNLPIKNGNGMIAWTANKSVSKSEKVEIKKIFSSLGTELELNENKLDAVTAISGSGPAYYFYFSELLVKAALKLGLSKQEAKILVEKTFIGSAGLLADSGLDFEYLKESVTSKKGTTASALETFKKNNLNKIITKAARAAHLRAKQLSANS